MFSKISLITSALLLCGSAYSLEIGIKDIKGIGKGCKYLNAGHPMRGDITFDELERIWLIDLAKKGSVGTDLHMVHTNFKEDKKAEDDPVTLSTCRVQFKMYSKDPDQKFQYKTNYFANEFTWHDYEQKFDAEAGVTISEIGAPSRSLISQARITQRDIGLLEFSFGGKQFESRCRPDVTIELKLSFSLKTSPSDAKTANSDLFYKRFLPLKAKIEKCN